jgi:hypothetical protein
MRLEVRNGRILKQLTGFGDALLQPIFVPKVVRLVERVCELSVSATLTRHRAVICCVEPVGVMRSWQYCFRLCDWCTRVGGRDIGPAVRLRNARAKTNANTQTQCKGRQASISLATRSAAFRHPTSEGFLDCITMLWWWKRSSPMMGIQDALHQ